MAGYDYGEDWLENWDEDFEEWEEFPEALYFDVIRQVLSPEYQDLSDVEMEDFLQEVLGSMSPEEVEGFWSTVRNLAGNVLPIAGQVVGTAVGGPVGAAIGRGVGQLAGQALSRPTTRPRPTPARPPVGGPPAGAAAQRPAAAPAASPSTAVPAGGSSATAQLMALLQNPALLQSILGQIIPGGRSSTPPAQESSPAPFGAYMNALSTLAIEAAMEANRWGAGQETPAYLLDAEGNFLCDPAVPEERARVLLEQLRQDYFVEACEDDDEGYLIEMDDEIFPAEWFSEEDFIESPLEYPEYSLNGRSGHTWFRSSGGYY